MENLFREVQSFVYEKLPLQLSVASKNNVIYNIITLIQEKQKTLEQIKSENSESLLKNYSDTWSLPLMYEFAERVLSSYELMRARKTISSVQCPKCKSSETETSIVQIRRADEGYTIFIKCKSCNGTSRIG
jgi:DNA-directed RNA polymerase subunit M/transcription elongation factor TFIIS